MKNIDYFKLQAKNLHKDYATQFFDKDEGIYDYDPKYFDINQIVLDFEIDEKEKLTLMKAQHIIAQMVGFDKWADLVKAPDHKLGEARTYLENHQSNSYNSTGCFSHNFDGRDQTFYRHGNERDVEYHEELSGQEWQAGIDECRKNKVGFDPDIIAECLHCGKRFPFGEVKVRRVKKEYNDGLEHDFKEIVCKHYPKCDGNLLDLLPTDLFEGEKNEK
ncbi:MAG: hypothetical protein LBR70_06985 [Lactobacillaceae bacterium]|jgi:hypothetical protein|nr:hypothetical protein [Lactobacillaceae bacterium]